MKYVISDSQKEVVGKVIQNFIDSELIKLKELAEDEDSELDVYETSQIETIESIKLFSLNKEEKDSLLWGINFKSTYQWSNKFHHDDIKNLIKKFL